MASLSISRAWDEANRFTRAELPLLAPVALAFLALPNLVSELVAPAAARGAPAAIGPWLIVTPLCALVQLLGQLTIIALASGSRLSVAEAVRIAGRRMPAAVALTAIELAALALLLLPIAPTLAQGAAARPGGALLLYMFALSLGLIWAGVRVIGLALAVVMVDGLAPITALRRSFDLTRGQFWRLFGFLLLFGTFYLIVLWATAAGIGSILALAGRATGLDQAATVLAVLASALVSAALIAWATLVLVAVRRQLAGESSGI